MPEYTDVPLAERQGKYAAIIAELKALLPRAGQVVTDPTALTVAYSADKSYHLPVPPTAVAIPSTVEEVAAVVKLCAAHKFPITPRGAGTGLEGGAIPYAGGVVIDSSRLQRMDFDPDNACVWVGAGVKKLALAKAAKKLGFTFGPDPSSNPSVGGMVSTSGSGMSTLKYGTTRENVLSLRVVTPQGSIMQTRQVVRKSSSGLELTQLYCGSEGTLGIVCEVAFRLWPLLKHNAGAIATFTRTQDAMLSIVAMKQAGVPHTLLRCEFLNEAAVKASSDYSKLTLDVTATVLLEFVDNDEALNSIRRDFDLVQCIFKAAGRVVSMRFLRPGAEMDDVWEARRGCLFAAMHSRGKMERVLTTDVCVPLTALAKVITDTENDFALAETPCLICAHIGDGNFHLNIPWANVEELQKLRLLEAKMIQRAVTAGGTVSGEHGVGVGKVKYLLTEHGEDHIRVQETIKKALDPDNIMNPGVFYPFQQVLFPTANL